MRKQVQLRHKYWNWKLLRKWSVERLLRDQVPWLPHIALAVVVFPSIRALINLAQVALPLEFKSKTHPLLVRSPISEGNVALGAGDGSVREGLRRGLGSVHPFGDLCARSGVVDCRGTIVGGYKAFVSRVVCGAAKVAGRSEPRCAIIKSMVCALGGGISSGGVECTRHRADVR